MKRENLLVLGSGNPLSDIEFVENEFDLWICSLILKDWDKIVRESENLKQRIEYYYIKTALWFIY